jgi:hypothetical protein
VQSKSRMCQWESQHVHLWPLLPSSGGELQLPVQLLAAFYWQHLVFDEQDPQDCTAGNGYNNIFCACAPSLAGCPSSRRPRRRRRPAAAATLLLSAPPAPPGAPAAAPRPAASQQGLAQVQQHSCDQAARLHRALMQAPRWQAFQRVAQWSPICRSESKQSTWMAASDIAEVRPTLQHPKP